MDPIALPPPDPMPSLAERVGALISADSKAVQPVVPGAGRRLGLMLAVVLPMGPVLTTGIAEWWAADTRHAVAASTHSPKARAAAGRQAERQALARLGGRSVAGTLDRVARLIPADDQLVTLETTIDAEAGPRLRAEIATVDPDRLRAAMARESTVSRLRTESERRGDGVLIVTVEGAL